MSVCYTISIGTQSGYSSDLDATEAAYKLLKGKALFLCGRWELIVSEALQYGAPVQVDGVSINEYGKKYNTMDDLTIRFDDTEYQIRQYASGSGLSRTLKEHLRRAFIRLIIREMHMMHIEINITVR